MKKSRRSVTLFSTKINQEKDVFFIIIFFNILDKFCISLNKKKSKEPGLHHSLLKKKHFYL